MIIYLLIREPSLYADTAKKQIHAIFSVSLHYKHVFSICSIYSIYCLSMRFLFEQMGADVNWNNTTQTAVVENADERVEFSINKTQAKVNNELKTMDVPARLVNNKTMIPLRFLSEELGYNVEWDQDTRTVIISD